MVNKGNNALQCIFRKANELTRWLICPISVNLNSMIVLWVWVLGLKEMPFKVNSTHSWKEQVNCTSCWSFLSEFTQWWSLLLRIFPYSHSVLLNKLTFDKMNLSFDGPLGSSMVYLIVLKNNTDITSAMEQHDVGWLQYRIYMNM